MAASIPAKSRSLPNPGIRLYGIASAAAGIMDFIWAISDASHQPIQAFGITFLA